MIDLAVYRCRIGIFNPKPRRKKFIDSNSWGCDNTGKNFTCILQAILKLFLILTLIHTSQFHSKCHFLLENHEIITPVYLDEELGPVHGVVQPAGAVHLQEGLGFTPFNKKMSPNFLARYTNGNIIMKKGLKNIHLNIRTLGNKMAELKHIAKEHSPHILGVSECELRKLNGQFNEQKLKVPGYNLLFPKSWDLFGFARRVVYVKNSLEYQQIHDLEDDLVQSIWLRGGYKAGKKIYFCHFYREHTSTMGGSIREQ